MKFAKWAWGICCLLTFISPTRGAGPNVSTNLIELPNPCYLKEVPDISDLQGVFDKKNVKESDALKEVINWVTSNAPCAFEFDKPTDVYLIVAATNQIDGLTFRTRNKRLVEAYGDGSNINYVIILAQQANTHVESGLFVALSDTEEYRQRQSEAFVQAVLALVISRKPISARADQKEKFAEMADLKREALETRAQLSKLDEELAAKNSELAKVLSDMSTANRAWAEAKAEQQELLNGFPSNLANQNREQKIESLSQASLRVQDQESRANELFHARQTLQTSLANLAARKNLLENKLLAISNDERSIAESSSGGPKATSDWTVQVYQGQYAPEKVPSRIETVFLTAATPATLDATGRIDEVHHVARDLRKAQESLLKAGVVTDSKEGEELVKLIKVQETRLAYAKQLYAREIESEARVKQFRAKEIQVGRPSPWSFGLAYSVKDSDDINFDIKNGKVDAKTDTKNPVFLAACYNFSDRLCFSSPDDNYTSPTLMAGFRAEIAQIEPMIGIGAGFKLKPLNVAARLWGGVAWVSNEELKGDAKPGQDAAENSRVESKREAEWLWGFTAEWML